MSFLCSISSHRLCDLTGLSTPDSEIDFALLFSFLTLKFHLDLLKEGCLAYAPWSAHPMSGPTHTKTARGTAIQRNKKRSPIKHITLESKNGQAIDVTVPKTRVDVSKSEKESACKGLLEGFSSLNPDFYGLSPRGTCGKVVSGTSRSRALVEKATRDGNARSSPLTPSKVEFACSPTKQRTPLTTIVSQNQLADPAGSGGAFAGPNLSRPAKRDSNSFQRVQEQASSTRFRSPMVFNDRPKSKLKVCTVSSPAEEKHPTRQKRKALDLSDAHRDKSQKAEMIDLTLESESEKGDDPDAETAPSLDDLILITGSSSTGTSDALVDRDCLTRKELDALELVEKEIACEFLESIWVGRDTFIRAACKPSRSDTRRSAGGGGVSTISVEGMGSFAITAKELECLLDNS
eukprot:759587-Hanusia_phi.AAC.2